MILLLPTNVLIYIPTFCLQKLEWNVEFLSCLHNIITKVFRISEMKILNRTQNSEN
jgi:hypothetical protein